MRNVVIGLFVFITLSITQAFAYDMNNFTDDAKIISAMNLLERNGEYGVFENLKKNAVKVSFSDLSEYSTSKTIYAVNTYNRYGRRVIMINSAFKSAPVEQIACLIAHESYHVARHATLEEETIATQKEAECWTKLKNNSVTYPQTKLTKRLDKIAGLYLASDRDNNRIHDKIASSGFYQLQFGM